MMGAMLHRLGLGHSVANTASCRVADRAGFRLEATLHSALLHSDGWHDMHLHARVGGRRLAEIQH
jgi:RimJ/RimL family protein N-acetyltransferase